MKTKALISFAVTAKLICVFVFAYAGCWFSHEAALFLLQKIVESLDESHTPLALTSSISTVISLGLEGEHMCYVISRVSPNWIYVGN